jgi:hypothetical protein
MAKFKNRKPVIDAEIDEIDETEDWPEEVIEVTHLRDSVSDALRRSQKNLEEQGKKAEKLTHDLRNGGGPKFLRAILGLEKLPA